jgi:hypothetical protein
VWWDLECCWFMGPRRGTDFVVRAFLSIALRPPIQSFMHMPRQLGSTPGGLSRTAIANGLKLGVYAWPLRYEVVPL